MWTHTNLPLSRLQCNCSPRILRSSPVVRTACNEEKGKSIGKSFTSLRLKRIFRERGLGKVKLVNGVTLVEDTTIVFDETHKSIIILKACFPNQRTVSENPSRHESLPSFETPIMQKEARKENRRGKNRTEQNNTTSLFFFFSSFFGVMCHVTQCTKLRCTNNLDIFNIYL